MARLFRPQNTPQRPHSTVAPRWFHFGCWATLATLGCLLLWMGNWRWSAFLDNVALDSLFAIRGSRPPAQVAEGLPQSKDIIIIELTHETPRPFLAELLDNLHEARAVGLDFMFADREGDLDEEEKPLYRKEIARWKREDRALEHSIANAKNIVLGAWPLRVSEGVRPEIYQSQVGDASVVGSPQKVAESVSKDGQQWSLPLTALAKAARIQSHLCVLPDQQDGLIRRVRLFENIDGKERPSFALALATLAQKGPIEKRRTPEQIAQALANSGGLDSQGTLLIDYLGPRNVFEYETNRITFNRAWQDAGPDEFRDKIVLVGQTDERSKDIFPTPWGDMPGLLIHANTVATLLSPAGPPRLVAPVVIFVVSLLFCLALVAALTRFPVWLCAPLALIETVLAVLLMGTLFIKGHMVLPLSVPVGALFVTYNGIAIYEYLRARSTLGHVVGKTTAAQLLDDVSRLQLGGRLEVATAFFCDLRGYTTISQQVPPEQLINFLNGYTAAVVREVRRFDGRPIDYFGDGVFVLFEGEDHAWRGVQAALAAQVVLDDLKRALLFEPPQVESKWLQNINLGIALHTGSMVIGLVGAEEHFKPGAVGDTVNVASRLQTLTPVCGFPVLISKVTLEACAGKIQPTSCGKHELRGRDGEFEVFGLGEPLPKKAEF